MTPRHPTVIAPGAGEIIGDSPDRRVEILSDAEELAATWSRFGPGRDGADRHIHYKHADLFYVLEGELAVKLEGDAETIAPAGSLVYIPPMVIHGFRNGSDEVEVKYLNLHAPGCGFADYMRGIRDASDTAWFDQFDPEGVEGIRPAEEIRIASGEGVLVDAEAISVSVGSAGAGAAPVVRPAAGAGVESFWVLEGELAFEFEDREGVAGPSTWLQTPTFAASELSFDESNGARWLTIHTPAASGA